MDTDFTLENSIICSTHERSEMGMVLSLTYKLRFSDGNDLLEFEVNDFSGPGYGLIIDEFNGKHFNHKMDELDEVGFTNVKVCDTPSLSRHILSVLRGLFENEIEVSWEDIENKFISFISKVRFNFNNKIEEDESELQ